MHADITVHPFQIWVGACTAVARSRDTSSDRGRIEGIRNELRPYDMDRFKRAADYAGTTQRVCGPLAVSGDSNDDVSLNLGCDYPDADRFQIVLWDIGGVEPIPDGATLCTAGLITVRRRRTDRAAIRQPGRDLRIGVGRLSCRHFAHRAVNQANSRKEFFFATPGEVREVLASKVGNLLEFAEDAEATEYFQSINRWPEARRAT